MNAAGEEDYDGDAFADEDYSDDEAQKQGARNAKNKQLDKEVEEVTRKQSAGVRQQPMGGGYALPDDDDDEAPGGMDPDAEDDDEDGEED